MAMLKICGCGDMFKTDAGDVQCDYCRDQKVYDEQEIVLQNAEMIIENEIRNHGLELEDDIEDAEFEVRTEAERWAEESGGNFYPGEYDDYHSPIE